LKDQAINFQLKTVKIMRLQWWHGLHDQGSDSVFSIGSAGSPLVLFVQGWDEGQAAASGSKVADNIHEAEIGGRGGFLLLFL
jgi:hypothetical protein